MLENKPGVEDMCNGGENTVPEIIENKDKGIKDGDWDFGEFLHD